jgi:anti-sigma factor RsiW
VSQRDQHLTTEQLSTWLDQQLTPEEQASCHAHLEDCARCQYALNNLRQTVNLLRSLPQLEVPRSFALPADFQITSDRNKQQWVKQSTARSPRRLPTPLRHSLRAVSALAAVIGLFLALSSFVAPLHSDRTSTSSVSAPAPTNLPSSAQHEQAPQLTSRNTANGSSNTPNKADDGQKSANTYPTPTGTHSTATESILPFDLNQPEERLSIGIPLVILGSIGFVLLAQRQKHRTSPVQRK